MVRAYWVMLTLSVIAALAAMIPIVVVYFSLYSFGRYSFGLAVPVLYVAANLWWVLILLGPVVYLQRAGKPVWGIAASLALAAAVMGGFYALRAATLQAIAAPAAQTMPGALVDRLAASVEIRDDNDRDSADAPCNTLCEGLLTAGADWVRVAGWGPKGEPDDLVFRRAEAKECLALDPLFPASAPCILLGRDDGRAADLLVRFEVSGDGHVAREDLRGLAFVFALQRLLVTDQRDGTVLHDQVSRHWMQAMAPIPLRPNAGFDGNGLHGGGLTFVWERLADPVPDAATVLVGLGQPVQVSRNWVETRPAIRPGRAAEGYWANLPQDRALMLSILEQGGETLAPGLVRQVQRWMQGLVKGLSPVAADRVVLKQLPGRIPPHTIGLNVLMADFPELFVDSMSDLYRMVRDGNESESRSAASTLLNRGRGDPPGAHADEAADYLAALESGRQWGYLIQIVGRYGFDPTPVLQREIDSPQDAEDGPDVYILITAACHSDPKWAATLGPFVHELVLPLTLKTQSLDYSRDQLSKATNALLRLGRSDLALDLRNRVDPETLAAEYEKNFTSARPPETAEELRDVFFGRMEKTGCF